MYLKCVLFLLVSILTCKQFNCLQNLNNFNDDSTSEPHSRIRDVQLTDNDTCLAINFENVNERQLPFYLYSKENFKLHLDQFTEDFIQVI